MSTKHLNSHKVIIYRTTNFFMNSQDPTIRDQVMKLTREGIGSYFEKKGSKIIGSGLTRDEIIFLMPALVGAEPTEKDFLAKVETFFVELNTSVPYGSGRELEIGLETNNSKPIVGYVKDSATGDVTKVCQMPLNVHDYIRYRHAKGHPACASSQSEAKGNQLKRFYIFDPVELEADTSSLIDVKDQATEIYMSIKTNPGKVDAMLTLMGVNIRELIGTNFARKRVEKLRDLAEKDAEKFVSRYKDKFFEEKYWLGLMLNTGVLHEVGGRYLNKQNELIGKTELDAIFYMRDPDNSIEVSLLKESVQAIITLRASREEEAVATVSEGATKKVPDAPLPTKGVKKAVKGVDPNIAGTGVDPDDTIPA